MLRKNGKFFADWRGRDRQEMPARLRNRHRGQRILDPAARAQAKGQKPKRIDSTATVAQAAEEWTRAQAQNPNTRAALAQLIEAHGGKLTTQLTSDHLQGVAKFWRERYAQHTRSTYSKCLRRFVLWLERLAVVRPTLSDAIPKTAQPGRRARPSRQTRNGASSSTPPTQRSVSSCCSALTSA